MADVAPHQQPLYTWADYRSWPDTERWELIDGVAYAMSPSPTVRHQFVSRQFVMSLASFFRGKGCEVFAAPIDVKLSDTDVVQPDVVVVCDASQQTLTHIEGPPALVIEILSPSSEVRDRHDKMALYARYGVREYWIVTPFPSLVEVYVLEGATYRVERVYRKDETLASARLPGLAIDLAAVFSFPLAPGELPETEQRRPPPA